MTMKNDVAAESSQVSAVVADPAAGTDSADPTDDSAA